MKQYKVTFLPAGITVPVDEGTTLLQAEIQAGLKPYAPCGGNGTCGKCEVTLQAGAEVLACQTIVTENMVVTVPQVSAARILTASQSVQTVPDGVDAYTLAIDIGTTTVVAYLLSGKTGVLLAQASTLNPQGQYGADVISRIQYVLDGGGKEMQQCILAALDSLTRQAAKQAGIAPTNITCAAIVGNTAMHHLLLDIDPRPLITPPYMPRERSARTMDAAGWLPISGKIRILPNIAGFVGGDTVGCLVASRFDRREKLTLLIDIGTNGEMVLGNRKRAVACSTAAGPAFEGAKISCGMRGAEGAVDHVFLKNGTVSYHVIGDKSPVGLCGSGLLDLIAVLLENGEIDEMGHLEHGDYTLCENMVLTQKDVREVQLAKAAIRAGIELMAKHLDVKIGDIEQVLLAGAFGNYLDPASACRIGMIPPELVDRIEPIGNAAGEGAKLCSLSGGEFSYAAKLAEETEFLELAALPEFQDCYVDCLTFEEDDE